MKISVIIPMYNGEETIIRCLNSIVSQTYKCHYEIIVIDDESKDNSISCVQSFVYNHPQLEIIIINKSNGGASTARNAGLRVASGNWIALLDCDDEWLPDKIKFQMSILLKNSHIDCLGGNLEGQKTRILGILKNTLSRIYQWQLLIKVYPQTSTVIFKKELIKVVGIYDESLRYFEDVDLWLRVAKQSNFWFSPKEMVIYDRGKAGFGVSGMTSKLSEMHEGNKVVLKKLYLNSDINIGVYNFALLYANIKYFRRIIITKIRKMKS